ncbi:MAG: hypothetical protein V4620_14720 [Bacteroidota bacterium]
MNSNLFLSTEIKLRVVKLLNQNKNLMASNLELENKINELNKIVEKQKNLLQELEDNNKIIKLAREMHLSTKEKQELKLELKEKIKLIDECIKMLSQ